MNRHDDIAVSAANAQPSEAEANPQEPPAHAVTPTPTTFTLDYCDNAPVATIQQYDLYPPKPALISPEYLEALCAIFFGQAEKQYDIVVPAETLAWRAEMDGRMAGKELEGKILPERWGRYTYAALTCAALHALGNAFQFPEGPTNKRVLSVGCESGLMETVLQQYLCAERDCITGIDIDPESVLHRVTVHDAVQLKPLGELRIMDGRHTSYPDRSFTGVMSMRALPWIPEWKTALSEWARVLEPDGDLYLSFYTHPAETFRGRANQDDGEAEQGQFRQRPAVLNNEEVIDYLEMHCGMTVQRISKIIFAGQLCCLFVHAKRALPPGLVALSWRELLSAQGGDVSERKAKPRSGSSVSALSGGGAVVLEIFI